MLKSTLCDSLPHILVPPPMKYFTKTENPSPKYSKHIKLQFIVIEIRLKVDIFTKYEMNDYFYYDENRNSKIVERYSNLKYI